VFICGFLAPAAALLAFALGSAAAATGAQTNAAAPAVQLPVKAKLHLYLLMGQSNMAGRGKLADAWAKAQDQQRSVLRACPDSSLLDLHLALHLGRRVNADHQIDFLGRSWPISPTARHTVTLIYHPLTQFWVVPHPPHPPLNRWPDILGKFSL
jgi:hypothetical protein